MSILLLGANIASSPLSATVDPSWVFGFRTGAGTAYTFETTTTAIGGVPPYTHAWTYVSGDTSFTATSPTAATTDFFAPVTFNVSKTAIWKDTVTDAASQTTVVEITVNVSEFSFAYFSFTF